MKYLLILLWLNFAIAKDCFWVRPKICKEMPNCVKILKQIEAGLIFYPGKSRLELCQEIKGCPQMILEFSKRLKASGCKK